MNTIPTTLNDSTVAYTVVGGPSSGACGDSRGDARSLPGSEVRGGAKGGSQASSPGDGRAVSVLLLERGSHLYRNEAFRELERLGFESIVSIAEGSDSTDLESLVQRYPRTRFIRLGEPASAGEKINIGIRESCTPYVFVLWSDMRLQAAGLSGRFFERLAEQDYLCLAPWLQTAPASGHGAVPAGDLLPSAVSPAFHHQSLKLLPLPPSQDGARSLYPYDYCGIYSRERFILTGGFDGCIENPYWQKLDFGFRSWLWGEEIRLSQALRVGYIETPSPDDSTADDFYKWFWLKNLAPVFRSDHADIPARRFWAYWRRRGGSPASALQEFRAALDWVNLNRFRFKQDAASLVELWEDETP